MSCKNLLESESQRDSNPGSHQFSCDRIDRCVRRNVLGAVSRSGPGISHLAGDRRPGHPPSLGRVGARVGIVPGRRQLRVLRRLPGHRPRVPATVVVRSSPVGLASNPVQLLLLQTLRVMTAVDSPRVGPIGCL